MSHNRFLIGIAMLLTAAVSGFASPLSDWYDDVAPQDALAGPGALVETRDEASIYSTWTEKILSGATLTEIAPPESVSEAKSREDALALAAADPSKVIVVRERPPSTFALVSLLLFSPLCLTGMVSGALRFWWRDVLLWEETGYIPCEVSEDEAGAGAPDGREAFDHRPLPVDPAVARRGHDHREFATHLIGG